MMQARVNLITADPDRMADTIGYIKTSVRPAVESMDGSLGLSLYANAEIGVAVLESFWESRKALIHSEQMAALRRTDVVHRAVGTVSIERYRVPVYEREAPLDSAVGLRLTRMDVDTGRIEDAVECFGATVVPRLADAGGFCGALLLVGTARRPAARHRAKVVVSRRFVQQRVMPTAMEPRAVLAEPFPATGEFTARCCSATCSTPSGGRG